MKANNLGVMPEELKSQIISCLDNEPPSSSWYLREPNPSLADAESRPLKNLSLVSKEWHRLVRPHLFRCVSMKLSPPVQSFVTRPPTGKFGLAIEAGKQGFKNRLFRGVSYPDETEWAYRHAWQDTAPEMAAIWIDMLNQTLNDLLSILKEGDLENKVETLSITLSGQLDDSAQTDYIREETHCLIASAAFWDVLFTHIEPSQVTIVAPPSTLACLLNCSVRMLDSWAFPGMSHQLVTLRRPIKHGNTTTSPTEPTGYNRSENVHLRLGPNDPARPALASLLYIRPWTHLFINEGSYLQAYSTYEYFSKEPPGITYPLAQGFEVPIALENITYRAVFPFHDYLAAAMNLMSTGIIRSLDVKLAPAADDKTWDSPARLGKADIADCWGEIEQVYSLLFRGPTPEEGHLAVHSNVTTFSSGDCAIESLRSLLRRSFAALEWDELDKGVWTISEGAAARRRVLQGLDDE